MIRKIILTAFVLAAGFASAAIAQSKQDFDLVNKTGYAIDEVYVTPADSDDWQNDVLGRDILANGDSVHIHFSRSAKTCLWDLKVVYDDKETAEWHDFDLCTTSKIVVRYNRKTGETSADYE
ncbi:MAG: hypothetical protein H7841_12580 [Magnetospirillum sp. WYHS-4]